MLHSNPIKSYWVLEQWQFGISGINFMWPRKKEKYIPMGKKKNNNNNN